MRAPSKRRRFIGCLTVFLLLAAGGFLGLFGTWGQVSTKGIISSETPLALHGPLQPDDAGFSALWDALVAGAGKEAPLFAVVLKWLGRPREVTFACYRIDKNPISVVAINFPRGSILLRIPFLFGTAHYRGARFLSLPGLTIGVYGSTLLLADDAATFCHAVDNLLRRQEKATPLPIKHSFHYRYDFVGFFRPHALPLDSKVGVFPAELAEIGVDIEDADKARCEVFWICQSKWEAAMLLRGLPRLEAALAKEGHSKGIHATFRTSHENTFVWWEIRLSGIQALFQ
ncbi:MAG: hypothetical protein IMHGJWDQ_002111 [Candidatus Fervidibacter sp.]